MLLRRCTGELSNFVNKDDPSNSLKTTIKKSTNNTSLSSVLGSALFRLHGAFFLWSLSCSVGFPWNLKRKNKVKSSDQYRQKVWEGAEYTRRARLGGNVARKEPRAWRVLRVSGDACISSAVKETQSDENCSNKRVRGQHKIIAHIRKNEYAKLFFLCSEI